MFNEMSTHDNQSDVFYNVGWTWLGVKKIFFRNYKLIYKTGSKPYNYQYSTGATFDDELFYFLNANHVSLQLITMHIKASSVIYF